MISLRPKRVSEQVVYSVDFTGYFAPGTTLAGSEVTVSVYSGDDANPSGILPGGSSVSGLVVSQEVINGIVGTIYLLLFSATGGAGQVIKLAAVLAIVGE